MCISLGLTMKKRGVTADQPDIVTTPAVTLRPTSTISARAFEDLKQKQVLWNVLIDTMARHPTFLYETLRGTADSDKAYTGKMLKMLQDVYGSPDSIPTQPAMLGVFRNDFMQDVTVLERTGSDASTAGSDSWKQVEINTISVSFAGLSPKVVDFQRQVDVMARNDEAAVGGRAAAEERPLMKIADSVSGKAIPEALGAAAAHYISQRPSVASADAASYTPVICLVVQEGERNTADQIALALEVERGTEMAAGEGSALPRRGVRCIRRTLMQLKAGMKLISVDPKAPPLAIIDGHYEVALFYFRSCYAPDDLPTEDHWNVRRDVELAAAIKCPSLPHYLCTYKKVQQVISQGVHDASVSSSSVTSDSLIAKLFSQALPSYVRDGPPNGASFFANALSSVLEPTDFFAPASSESQEIASSPLLVDSALQNAIKGPKEDPSGYLAQWIESNFVPIYSLNPAENPAGSEALVQEAIANPDSYVLKPMLEGAGRIYARGEMVELLRTPKPAEGGSKEEADSSPYWTIRREYILMKRINVRQFPSLRDAHDGPSAINGSSDVFSSVTVEDAVRGAVDKRASTLLRHGVIVPLGEVKASAQKQASATTAQDLFSTLVSELGIYGVVLTTAKNAGVAFKGAAFPEVKVLHNKFGGYVVRSKPSSVEGGGVMAGAAFLDALQVVE